MKCYCCQEEAKCSILVSDGSTHQKDKPFEPSRVYLPNQLVRERAITDKGLINELWFCHECMRKIEDNLRATILYLKTENNQSEFKNL
jgi:hypothetical protein